MTVLASTRDQGAAARTNGRHERVLQSARPRTQELFRQMNRTVYQAAFEQGMSLSAYLEYEDPSTPDELREGLDAFSRLIQCAGIRVKSMPGIGLPAHEFGEFDRDDQTRALAPEWMTRVWRRAANGDNRSLILSSDNTLGTPLNPFVDVVRPRPIIQPAIPLTSLVAITTGIDSDAYRAFYLKQDVPANYRMVRVAESAEIPRAKLLSGSYNIRLHKYGRVLEISYEALRRMPIDKVAFFLQILAVQTEADKVAAALDVLINGDGNPGTAALVYNLTALDPAATTPNLTLKAWLAWKMKYLNPYTLTTVLGQDSVILSMFMLNTGSANIPLFFIPASAGFGSIVPINRTLADGVEAGWMTEAPSNKIVGFDSRFALERVFEVGANLQEIDKWITRQVQILAITEVEGFAIADTVATSILNLAA